MAKVLKYLLTSVMVSLSHNDRLVNSTSKSNLLNYVNSQFVTGHSSSIDGTIIGAAFFSALADKSTGYSRRNSTINLESDHWR